MKANSLAFRLIVSSAIVSCVLLLAAAILLNGLFQQALERNFDARLRAVLDGLIANVELAPSGEPRMASPIADTRFELPESGWYWQVSAPASESRFELASQSLLEQRLIPATADLATRDSDGIASFYLRDKDGKQLRAIEQRFALFGSEAKYAFLVSGNFDELRAEVDAFRRLLYLILALLGVGLLLATFIQVRFGLAPMQVMRRKLNIIRGGKAETLEGDFPEEMQSVADELNLLIKSNVEVLDRARTQVGNLAHALKTPLSVLTNEAAKGDTPLALKVTEQSNLMRDQISLYLDRARRAARAKSLGAVCDARPVVEAIARTLQRINIDRKLVIDAKLSGTMLFRGEQQDLEEIIGNLMDNACKWARTQVSVTGTVQKSADGRGWLVIHIDDDGPGIEPAQRHVALQRGQRLDETKPGSGLGLNIVVETVAMYGGKLELAEAVLHGLRATVTLPAVIE